MIRRRAGGDAGLTLLEVLVTLFLFSLVMGGVTALMVMLLRRSEAVSETELAVAAISSKLEELRGHFPYGGTQSSLYATFADRTFPVTGLAQADGSDAGRVLFLDEAQALAAQNLPGLLIDIDGDGVTGEPQTPQELAAAVAAGRACVVRVEVRWSGREGDRVIGVATVMFQSESD